METTPEAETAATSTSILVGQVRSCDQSPDHPHLLRIVVDGRKIHHRVERDGSSFERPTQPESHRQWVVLARDDRKTRELVETLLSCRKSTPLLVATCVVDESGQVDASVRLREYDETLEMLTAA